MGGMAETESKQPGIGPIGRNLIRNFDELREVRRLSYRKVSSALAGIGRPIFALGLQRVTAGQRRVDVDELVALALVLNVSPSALMLPRDVDVDDDAATIQLTESVSVGADAAWLWMDGRMPLPLGGPPDPSPDPESRGRGRMYETPHDQAADFNRYSRPTGSGTEMAPVMAAAENLMNRLKVFLRDRGNPAMWDLYKNNLNLWYERLGFELRALLADDEARVRQQYAASGVPKAPPGPPDPPPGWPGTPSSGEQNGAVNPLDPFGKRER